MKTLYSLALLVCLLFVFQQNQAQSKYGNATMDELNMQVYPKDTTAAAVVLLKSADRPFESAVWKMPVLEGHPAVAPV